MGIVIHEQYIRGVNRKRIVTLFMIQENVVENIVMSKNKYKVIAHRGARTHDHKVKSLALYRLSQTGLLYTPYPYIPQTPSHTYFIRKTIPTYSHTCSIHTKSHLQSHVMARLLHFIYTYIYILYSFYFITTILVQPCHLTELAPLRPHIGVFTKCMVRVSICVEFGAKRMTTSCRAPVYLCSFCQECRFGQ